ncbi:hypothetical protein CY35_02G131200 [Sphagnum magellanicum]|nr:hypothetical protein CY35_02G131200 [Sphagnum magellanicum]
MAKQKEEGSGEWEDKAENAWSYYTAQAQEIGRKALQSKDDALKTAKSQLGQLQDASSHHLTTAQNIAHTVSQQYAVYEDIFFSKLKEGVHTISRYPNVAYGVFGVTTLLALRTPRRLLFRLTIGRFQSEEAMYARAEAKVKEMRQSVDLLKNETRKLEERARLAEEELQRGRTKLKNTGGQLSSLVRSIYKTESHARGLMDSLRELPGREALRLRAEVAAMSAEAKQQRGVLDKRVTQIANYGIPV